MQNYIDDRWKNERMEEQELLKAATKEVFIDGFKEFKVTSEGVYRGIRSMFRK